MRLVTSEALLQIEREGHRLNRMIYGFPKIPKNFDFILIYWDFGLPSHTKMHVSPQPLLEIL